MPESHTTRIESRDFRRFSENFDQPFPDFDDERQRNDKKECVDIRGGTISSNVIGRERSRGRQRQTKPRGICCRDSKGKGSDGPGQYRSGFATKSSRRRGGIRATVRASNVEKRQGAAPPAHSRS